MTGLDSSRCSICRVDLDDPEFAATYVTLVCRQCDDRAVNADGDEPWFDTWSDSGENPVFIGGIKCWRRYRFGGLVTMRDLWDCSDIGEFYERIGFV